MFKKILFDLFDLFDLFLFSFVLSDDLYIKITKIITKIVNVI